MVAKGDADEGEEPAEVLRRLVAEGWTGRVSFAAPRGAVSLQVEDGRLVAASSAHPDHRLLDLLLRVGVIDLAQHTALRGHARPEAELLRQGALRPRRLEELEAQLAEEVVESVLLADACPVRLEPGRAAGGAGGRLRRTTPELVLQALRRVASWPRVEQALGGAGARYVRSEGYLDILPEMPLSFERLSLLTDLNGVREVSAICAESTLPDFEVCVLLWAFRVVGAIRPVAAVVARPAEDEDGLGEVLGGEPHDHDEAQPAEPPSVVPVPASPATSVPVPPAWPAPPPFPSAGPPGPPSTSVPTPLPPPPSLAPTGARPTPVPTPLPPVPVPVPAALGQALPVEPRRRIVMVGLPESFQERLEPLLRRTSFSVESVASAAAAFAACGPGGVDLMMTTHRPPDLPLHRLVETVCAAHRVGHVVVVAEASDLPELRRALRRDEVAVLLDEPGRLVEEIAARLLGAARRVSLRLLVRVDVALQDSRKRIMCQSENLSSKGVLLRTNETYPLGTAVALEFTLPGDRSPIVAQGEVVRHADPEAEKLRGMGLAFRSFKADGLVRLERHLQQALQAV